METRYAIGMGSHACVSSSPAGGEYAALFFLLFPFLFRLFLFLFYRPFHCSVLSLSISSLTVLCRSSAFDSVPVSKLLVLSTISPFTTPFLPFTAFRSRISASFLNNCPLRKEVKGYQRNIEELKNQKIERCITGGESLLYKYINHLFNINTCLYLL